MEWELSLKSVNIKSDKCSAKKNKFVKSEMEHRSNQAGARVQSFEANALTGIKTVIMFSRIYPDLIPLVRHRIWSMPTSFVPVLGGKPSFIPW